MPMDLDLSMKTKAVTVSPDLIGQVDPEKLLSLYTILNPTTCHWSWKGSQILRK